MYVQRIVLKNFRCFLDTVITCNNRFVLVSGKNGSGKTSLFEALYYCSYLKSFRTSIAKELFSHGSSHFFLQVDYAKQSYDPPEVLSVGINPSERVVKFNNNPIRTHKELISQFPVVVLAADDIELIKGYPEARRAFLNYSSILYDSSTLQIHKNYRRALVQRNSLLATRDLRRGIDDSLYFWTEQVWEKATLIQASHRQYLYDLEDTMNRLLKNYFPTIYSGAHITLSYAARYDSNDNFPVFLETYKQKLYEREHFLKRTCFGAHLDDFRILFKEGNARSFASRGQQKLLAFLLKFSQIIINKKNCLFLLDDFLTDFDHNLAEMSLEALKCEDKGSVFIASPIESSLVKKVLTPDHILL